jgi:hypothetical protein
MEITCIEKNSKSKMDWTKKVFIKKNYLDSKTGYIEKLLQTSKKQKSQKI